MTQKISGAARPPIPGFTRLSSPGTISGIPGKVTPTGFILQDHEGYDYYIWVGTDGSLHITDAETAEAASFDWDSGGTHVGAQT
jgi:hypothetical protein